MPQRKSFQTPFLKEYSGQNLDRVALPLGGIGTGTVSLGGRGDLRDWEIMSRPGKGYSPSITWDLAPVHPFLAVRARPKGGDAVAKLLEGPLADSFADGPMGTTATNHGMPRFREARFTTAYPFGQVHLSDRDFPLKARIEAFNPLVPGDTEASSLPVAALRVVLKNPSRKAVEASVCFTVPNFIGDDGGERPSNMFQWSEQMKRDKTNVNRFRTAGNLRGLHMSSNGLPEHDDANGSLAVSTNHRGALSYRRTWAPFDGGDSRQEFWDDFLEDGELRDYRNDKFPHPPGSLCPSMTIPAGGERTLEFFLVWHFPNRTSWSKKKKKSAEACNCAPATPPENVGNYYAHAYRDAWDATRKIVPKLAKLERASLEFVDSVSQSDLPDCVKEAALFNLSTLRSQTTFRTASGHLCGWEGCFDSIGCCPGSCTHVWNYETATGALFGDLARSMREAEFLHATDTDGRQAFRIPLPIGHKDDRWNSVAAADGAMGTIVRGYREWQRSGDEAFLRQLWPAVRRVLEFCWIPGGWDADRDGVMEGCQHNTMDVEYLGPNPQMTGWYLAALRAGEAMARHLGEEDFAATCTALAENGRKKMEADLFNGEYFEHIITPAKSANDVADGLMLGAGAAVGQDPTNPAKQLGSGCLVDQLVGVHQARLNGLDGIIRPTTEKKTLRAIYRHNFRKNFHGHFNHLRSYVSPEDAGLLMATYPRGRRPERPFPYWNEVMTGFEYTAAAHMIAVEMEKEGLRCIEAIRARYDGRRRNPFNEAECGYHYARAMASWSTLEAWTGFRYSAVEKTIRFKAREGTFPWAAGDCWGTVKMKHGSNGRWSVRLETLGGRHAARTLHIEGVGEAKLSAKAKQSVSVS
jgi:uncharacterized protein (DUF608 family)